MHIAWNKCATVQVAVVTEAALEVTEAEVGAAEVEMAGVEVAEVEVAEVEVAEVEVEVAEVVARQARPWAGVAVSGVVAVVAAGVVLVAGVRVLKVVAAYPLWSAELLQKQCCLTPFVHDLTGSGCTVVLWMCSMLRG